MAEDNKDSRASICEQLDPRIQIELEKLNRSAEDINRLELLLDDARSTFRQQLTDSTQQLNTLAKRLGGCIEKARPYYEARVAASETQRETQNAALRYERACGQLVAAKEMVNLAEQGYFKNVGQKFDPAWQEIMNQSTIKVNDAEKERHESWLEHEDTAARFNQAEQEVNELFKTLKRSIVKSQTYFEQKALFHQRMEEQKKLVGELEKAVSAAKSLYAEALKNLEFISEDIHRKRAHPHEAKEEMGARGSGVGAESPTPPPEQTEEDPLAITPDETLEEGIKRISGWLKANLGKSQDDPGSTSSKSPTGEQSEGGNDGAGTSGSGSVPPLETDISVVLNSEIMEALQRAKGIQLLKLPASRNPSSEKLSDGERTNTNSTPDSVTMLDDSQVECIMKEMWDMEQFMGWLNKSDKWSAAPLPARLVYLEEYIQSRETKSDSSTSSEDHLSVAAGSYNPSVTPCGSKDDLGGRLSPDGSKELQNKTTVYCSAPGKRPPRKKKLVKKTDKDNLERKRDSVGFAVALPEAIALFEKRRGTVGFATAGSDGRRGTIGFPSSVSDGRRGTVGFAPPGAQDTLPSPTVDSKGKRGSVGFQVKGADAENPGTAPATSKNSKDMPSGHDDSNTEILLNVHSWDNESGGLSPIHSEHSSEHLPTEEGSAAVSGKGSQSSTAGKVTPPHEPERYQVPEVDSEAFSPHPEMQKKDKLRAVESEKRAGGSVAEHSRRHENKSFPGVSNQSNSNSSSSDNTMEQESCVDTRKVLKDNWAVGSDSCKDKEQIDVSGKKGSVTEREGNDKFDVFQNNHSFRRSPTNESAALNQSHMSLFDSYTGLSLTKLPFESNSDTAKESQGKDTAVEKDTKDTASERNGKDTAAKSQDKDITVEKDTKDTSLENPSKDTATESVAAVADSTTRKDSQAKSCLESQNNSNAAGSPLPASEGVAWEMCSSNSSLQKAKIQHGKESEEEESSDDGDIDKYFGKN